MTHYTRLIINLSPAVAKAAMDSGVASRPIQDFDAYRDHLRRFVYQSGTMMEPVFAAAKRAPKRVVYAEGEDERVLRAAQAAVDEGLVYPVLVGRPDIITARIDKLGLRLKLGQNCEGVNILDDSRYRDYWQEYYQLTRRKGVSCTQAMEDMRSRPTLVGAMMVRRGDADAMLCGTLGNFAEHLKYVRNIIGLREGVHTLAAMQMLILPGRHLFICDTHVNRDPSAEQIAEMTVLAAEEVQRFGQKPSVALLSHSSFGSSDAASAQKMRDAVEIVLRTMPGLEVEGEMRADAALSKSIRDHEFPDSRLTTDANLLVMPNVDAANITYNALRVTAGAGITVGGILLGAAKPVHIMTPSSTVRRIVNNDRGRRSRRRGACTGCTSVGSCRRWLAHDKTLLKRDRKAAARFLRKAIGYCGMPAKITIDKSGANTAAIESYNVEHEAGIELRQVKYLNHIVEQDHRAIKRMTRPMLGFKSFWSAAITLAGIECMHMIRKGQLQSNRGETTPQRSFIRWPREAARTSIIGCLSENFATEPLFHHGGGRRERQAHRGASRPGSRKLGSLTGP